VAPATLQAGEWQASFLTQDIHGSEYHFTGKPAEIQDGRLLIRADDITYDKETGDVRASGHVYYRNFERNTQIWASRVEYNTDEETGKFYEVRGETHPRIVTRPGILTVDAPFYFTGDWAERVGDRYILYNGWATNCKLPKPWWRLKGRRFEIVPDEKAISRNSTFLVRKMPIFYTPYYYHSLAKEPRKSGFLIPSLVPHSQRGFMVGLGYYWAISRSYDATYRFQDFTTQAFTHHLDLRGKPRPGTEFNAIVYGAQDRGIIGGTNPQTYSGLSVYVVGKSDLGNGWTANGLINQISSFGFRQYWSDSFSESIASEFHSVGYLNKNWSSYTTNVVFSRLENFESIEIEQTDPVTGETHRLTNSVLIRKLPEAELVGRDRRIWNHIPAWLSFDAFGGLLYRTEPIFDGNTLVDRFQTGQFTNRLNFSPHLTAALHWGAFHIVPSIGFTETYYGEAQSRDPATGLYHPTGTNIVRSARDATVDFIFPSLARVFQKKTVFGDKLKHVIEPRATYRYVTGIGSDFDRFIRFDENDLLANTNEVELSLTNRIYAKRGDSVEEILTWELVQKRYFDTTFGGALLSGERNVFASTADISAYAFLAGPRSASPVVSKLRMSPVSGLGIRWQAEYDSHYHGIVDSAFGMDYRWKRVLFIAENNLVHKDLALQTPAANQFHFRTSFGDANRRGINGAMDVAYDYRNNVLQYVLSTLSFNTDCCGISAQMRFANFGVRPPVPEIRIAFAVANIGTFGTLRRQDRMF
jgi:LPS-assembly protein